MTARIPQLISLTAGVLLSLCTSAPVLASSQQGETQETDAQGEETPFAGFDSPYYVFQFGPGENWIDGVDPFEQDLAGHFAYMGQLVGEGVLVHGGPLDRGDGSHAMGVIRANSLEHAYEIMARDPAVQADVYSLLALDRWIALAGSGDGIDASEIVPPDRR
ncbi:YciI family protein [Hyphobacterium sp.]|uniref:YciI family protein n=1 Tax=Hyphobacterium sp. TaxID=2004662 RepID=UPI003B51A697